MIENYVFELDEFECGYVFICQFYFISDCLVVDYDV